MPDAGTLERLVYLRQMLREAQQRAQDRTHAGRHLAANQLDGVCEHAMMLATGELGKAPGNFHSNFNQLKGALPGWQADGWSGVNRLHGSRTEAQHRGTVPDPTEFARWSADVERFVSSLVAEVFAVDLQTAATAQAVETAEVRELLERAEAELAAENFNESCRASADALNEAREHWVAERTDALGPVTPRSTAPYDLTDEAVSQAIARMEDLGTVQTFASDLGEYIWLRKVRQLISRGVPATRDDAERGLAFVVSWVLRWEAFSHRYGKDRLDEWLRGQRPQTTSDPNIKPSVQVLGAVPVKSGRPGEEMTTTMAFQIVDVPEEGAAFWLRELGDRCMAEWQTTSLTAGGFPSVDGRGLLRVYGVSDEVEAKCIAELINRAVDATHGRWLGSVAEVEASKVDLDEVEARFADAVKTVNFDGTPFVTDTRASGRLVGHGADRRYQATVAMTLSVDDASFEWQQLWRALEQTGELGPGGGGRLDLNRRTLVAPATMAPDRLREIVETAVQELEAHRHAVAEERATAEAKAAAIADAARSAL